MKKTTKKTVKKQSGPYVSTLAAKMLRKLDRIAFEYPRARHVTDNDEILLRDLRSICASVLSQDETRGQDAPVRKKKAGR